MLELALRCRSLGQWKALVPLIHEALPSPFDFGLVEIIDIQLLLNI